MIRVAVGIASLLFLLPASGDSPSADALYAEGQTLVKAGNAAQAMQKFLDAAQKGHADAENEIGKLYFQGKGVNQSSDEATYWFNRSAQNGSIRGMTNLGLMYFGDRGMRADFDKAALWLTKAAEQGQPVAMCGLATLYLNGQGVPQDFAKAFELDTKAAQQGVVDAYNDLGKLYLLGAGVKKDSKTAFEWFQKAADGGSVKGMANVGLMYVGDRGIPADTEKALHWLSKAAEQGEPMSQFRLARFYQKGKDVPRDSNKAIELYLKSAQSGFAPAQVEVGDSYLYRAANGNNSQDVDQAVAWYKKAVESHDPEVLVQVAARYTDPDSPIWNPDAALPYLSEAVKAGNAQAMYDLAEGYEIGIFGDGKSDPVKAAGLYKASAERGYGSALYDLAKLYLKGQGIEKNAFEAYVSAALAIERGVPWASVPRDEAAKTLTPEQLEKAKAEIERRREAWK